MAYNSIQISEISVNPKIHLAMMGSRKKDAHYTQIQETSWFGLLSQCISSNTVLVSSKFNFNSWKSTPVVKMWTKWDILVIGQWATNRILHSLIEVHQEILGKLISVCFPQWIKYSQRGPIRFPKPSSITSELTSAAQSIWQITEKYHLFKIRLGMNKFTGTVQLYHRCLLLLFHISSL